VCALQQFCLLSCFLIRVLSILFHLLAPVKSQT
jgi:hypothetical protein